MKTLFLVICVLLGSAFTSGDFGEGGGPRFVRAYTLRSSDLVGYKNRIDYSMFISALAKKSFDIEYNKDVNFFELMKSNLINKGHDKLDYEEFIIKKSKLPAKEFGKIELQTISAFYLKEGEIYYVDDICSYVVALKRKKDVAQLGSLIQLNSCSGKNIALSSIEKIKVEYRK